LLRKTGLPTPRRCAPESRSLAAPYAARKWVRALPDYFKAEARTFGLRPMGFGMNVLGMAPPFSQREVAGSDSGQTEGLQPPRLSGIQPARWHVR